VNAAAEGFTYIYIPPGGRTAAGGANWFAITNCLPRRKRLADAVVRKPPPRSKLAPPPRPRAARHSDSLVRDFTCLRKVWRGSRTAAGAAPAPTAALADVVRFGSTARSLDDELLLQLPADRHAVLLIP
jgi:hypothetical protein